MPSAQIFLLAECKSFEGLVPVRMNVVKTIEIFVEIHCQSSTHGPRTAATELGRQFDMVKTGCNSCRFSMGVVCHQICLVVARHTDKIELTGLFAQLQQHLA